MCGILGWYNFEKKPSIDILRNLSKSLFHRGPDAYGEYESENISFVHRRLSIIDLSKEANQPFRDKLTNNIIVFNGEIYNFKEIKKELLSIDSTLKFLTKGDTEVILKAYQIFGLEKTLQKLDGMFAFAIWDSNKKKLFLARDKLGEKPLFYSKYNNSGVIFGSTFSVLSLHPEIKRNFKLNLSSLNQYLNLNYLLFENTFDENIKSLKPSTYLIIENKNNTIQIKEKKYWYLSNCLLEKKNYSIHEAKERFIFLLKNSIKSRIISDVSVGTYLSGGVDSSIMALLMKEMYQNKYSLHHLSFSEKSFDESNYVKILAQKHNLSPNIYKAPNPSDVAGEFAQIVSAMDQPMSDTAFISNFYLSKFSSKSSKVVISGDGGDELLAGYATYTADMFKDKITFMPKFILDKFNNLIIKKIRDNYSDKVSTRYKIKKFFENITKTHNESHILWRSIFNNRDLLKLLENKLILKNENYFDMLSKEYLKVKNAHFLDQHMYIDLKTWFTNDILYKIDRSTMHHSQEARIPLLDPKIIEFCFSLPINLKINLFDKKILLKKILEDKIGKKFVNRKKAGFNSPVGRWIAEDKVFYELTSDLLYSKRIKSYFNTNEINKILKNHINKKEDNTYKIFNIMVLSQWLNNNRLTL